MEIDGDGDGGDGGGAGTGITFSRFKYRFHNLLTEVRALKSKESSARMEAEILVQESRSKLAEQEKQKSVLQAQIAEAVETRQKLENSLKITELEMVAMEKSVSSSKIQLKAVLDSRNIVMEDLKIANYDLEQQLKNTGSRLAVATEKLSRNAMLFEAVDKEASSVKRTLDETRQLVASRAETVAELHQQVAWMVDAEQKLLDKARKLERELRNKDAAYSEKEKELVELRHLLDSRNDSRIQAKLTIMQRSLESKDKIISALNADKQGLISEVEILKTAVKRFQEASSEQDSVSKILREKLQELLKIKQSDEQRQQSSQEQDARETHEQVKSQETDLQIHANEIKEPAVIDSSSCVQGDVTVTNDAGSREENLQQQCSSEKDEEMKPADTSMMECVSCNDQMPPAKKTKLSDTETQSP